MANDKSKNMLAYWTAHISDDDEKERFLQRLLNSTAIFEALEQILEREKLPMKRADYTNPSWAYKQAHDNGYEELRQRLLVLIKPFLT